MFDDFEIFEIMKTILEAILEMHKLNIAHRNLNANNIIFVK